MEDKFTNKKTVDQAWNTMRGILDKEMPVEEKKRRFALWPLGLAASFLLLFGFMTNWTLDMPGHMAQADTTRVVIDKPITNTKHSTKKEELLENENTREKSIENPINTKLENQKSVTINQSKQIKSNKNKLPIVSKAQSHSKQVVLRTREQKSINDQIVLEDFVPQKKSREDRTSKISKTEIVSTTKQQEEVEKSNKKELVIEDVKSYKIPQLDSTTIASHSFVRPPVDVEDIDTEIQHDIPTVIKEEKNKNWAIQVYGAQHLANWAEVFKTKARIKSVGLEFVYYKEIKTNWRIGLGLGYKHVGIFTRVGEEEFTRHNGQGGFDHTSNSQDRAEKKFMNPYIGIANSHFLSLPIFVEKSLSDRWTIESGLRYNQKVGKFFEGFGKENRKNSVDFFLAPSYKISNRWSTGLLIQHNTPRFKFSNFKELGRNQIGIFTRFSI